MPLIKPGLDGTDGINTFCNRHHHMKDKMPVHINTGNMFLFIILLFYNFFNTGRQACGKGMGQDIPLVITDDKIFYNIFPVSESRLVSKGRKLCKIFCQDILS